MKLVIKILGSGVIGIITSLLGVGWFKGGELNPLGAVVNIVCVILWVLIINIIPTKND